MFQFNEIEQDLERSLLLRILLENLRMVNNRSIRA